MAQTQMLLQSMIFTFSIILPCVSSGSPPHIQALVAPISKDTFTSLYTLKFNHLHSLVLDISGAFLWFHCPKHHPTIPCTSNKCPLANSFHSPLCSSVSSISKKPCTCTAFPINPISGTCVAAQLTHTNFSISTTDGRMSTSPVTVPRFVSSCAPKSLLEFLPINVYGIAGLSRSRLALPSQLASSLSLKRKFGMCLPSTSTSPGVAFFGDGPLYLRSGNEVNVKSILSYTPLLTNPTNPDYYIDLKCIAINQQPVRFLARMLDFDSLGHGGVKLSTMAPYTTFRSHIYRSFLEAFAKATGGIPRAPKVQPFHLCLNTSGLGSTRVGLPVPQVDLMLANGKNWTIFGANSMKQVSNDVACLAFLDGGEKVEQSVVIGSFQMENNFLLFDLLRSRLGFSSSLLWVRTACANFDFKSLI